MKKVKFIEEKYKWIIFIVLLIIFTEITVSIFKNEIYILDNFIYGKISCFINPNMTTIMKAITTMGSAIPIAVVCVMSFILMKNKNYGKYITINAIIIFLLNQTMKFIFQRQRPSGIEMVSESGYSFPSGHSMVSLAFYGFILYLVLNKIKNPCIKWGSAVILITLIILIGISRIYLGAHYASDVIGGFLVSCSYLIVYTNFVKEKAIEEKNT